MYIAGGQTNKPGHYLFPPMIFLKVISFPSLDAKTIAAQQYMAYYLQ